MIKNKYGLILAALVISGCANTPAMIYERVPTYASAPDLDTPLAKSLSEVKVKASGESGAYPLPNGIEALAIRTSLIKQAKRTLDVQYHSIHKGISTALLTKETIEAAERGVKIRILIDGVDAQGTRSHVDLMAAHANVQVRVYNPVQRLNGSFITRNGMFLLHLKKLHRRMHHKMLIADGVVGLTGGRNIGDAYFSADGADNFSDLDVLLGGKAVARLEESFDEYWNSPNTLPVQAIHSGRDQAKPSAVAAYDKKIKGIVVEAHEKQNPYVMAVEQTEPSLLAKAFTDMSWGEVEVVSDPADKINHSPKSRQIVVPEGLDKSQYNNDNAVFNRMVDMIKQAKRDVVIANAYILPGEPFVQLLENTVKRGVRVTVVTNSLESNDVPFVMSYYGLYRQRLIAAGVQWYELRGFPNPPSTEGNVWKNQFYSDGKVARLALHTKAMTVDGTNAYVGSMNLDPRSIVWNTEMGVFYKNRDFAEQIRLLILNAAQSAYSYEVKLNQEGKLTWPASPNPSNYDLRHNATRPETVEPGSNRRKFIRWFAKIVPETYM